MTAATPTPNVCADCQLHEYKYEIRRRKLCAACLVKYVGSKALKRMEAYTFKNVSVNTKTRLFLPLSGGVSSLTLLEILDAHQTRQITKQNRTSFDLVIAHVELEGHDAEEFYHRVQARYARHTFLPILALEGVLRVDQSLEQGFNALGLYRTQVEEDAAFLHRCLSSTKTPTALVDIQQLLLKRLLLATARAQQCTGILWGHSDSRLAALALADVAKGRGGSVPTTIADGPSSNGIDSTYPLRDLFKSELELYLGAVPTPLTDLVSKGHDVQPTKLASVKNTAIDTLLTQYITSQGEKYPGIMANVVRTASKLNKPASSQIESTCCLCLMPILKVNTVNGSVHNLCQGCQRIKQDIKIQQPT